MRCEPYSVFSASAHLLSPGFGGKKRDVPLFNVSFLYFSLCTVLL